MHKEYITTCDPGKGGAYLRDIGGLNKKEMATISDCYLCIEPEEGEIAISICPINYTTIAIMSTKKRTSKEEPRMHSVSYGTLIKNSSIPSMLKKLEVTKFRMLYREFGMGISIKKERNLFNVIMCWLIPTIVYLDAFFWRSEVFWYIIALVIIWGNIFLVGIYKKMKKSAIPGDVRYLMFMKKTRYVAMRIFVCVALVFGLLLGMNNKSLNNLSQQVSMNSTDQIPSYDEWLKRDTEGMLSNQLQYLSGFENWTKITQEQKAAAISALLKVEKRYLGIPDKISVKIEKLQKLASFNLKDNIFYISNVKYYDVKTDGYEIVNLICYGMFCKYINTQTELYKELYSSKEFEIYGNLQMFDRIILYSDDKKGREQINTDCLNYAKKCTENYKKSITEYTKKQQVK